MPDSEVNPNADEETGELMYVRCSLCGEWMDVKPGRLHWVSHGLCQICHDREMARIQILLDERRRQRGDAPSA